MMKNIVLLLLVLFLYSCNNKKDNDEIIKILTDQVEASSSFDIKVLNMKIDSTSKLSRKEYIKNLIINRKKSIKKVELEKDSTQSKYMKSFLDEISLRNKIVIDSLKNEYLKNIEGKSFTVYYGFVKYTFKNESEKEDSFKVILNSKGEIIKE